MMRSLSRLRDNAPRWVLAGSMVGLLAGCNGGGMGMDMDMDHMPGHLAARLTGAAEVPGPGDPDGSGTFSIHPDTRMATRMCYDLSVAGIATATAGHIHRGASGVSGPVVVPLMAPANGKSEGCVDVTAALAAEIMANPGGFYANVHNAEFPAGAVRGQLGR